MMIYEISGNVHPHQCISRIRIKNDQKKHVRPVLQTTISCQSNYSIVKKIKVRLVELRGMPHQLEKSKTHQSKTHSLGRIISFFGAGP